MLDNQTAPVATPATESASPAEDVIPNLYKEVATDGTQTAEDVASDVTDETTEKPKAPKEQRAAVRIAAAKKAELRSSREREAVTRDRESLAKERTELEQFRARVKSMKDGDPLPVLEELGLANKEFLERIAKAGEVDPNDRAKAAEARAAKAESRVDEFIRDQQTTVMRAQAAQAVSAFVGHIASNVEKYPTLAQEFTPDEIAEQGISVVREHGAAYLEKFGEPPSDEVVADYLELRSKERNSKKLAATLATRSARQASPRESIEAPSVTRAQSPRTLTNRHASEKASGTRDLTQEEIDQKTIEILRNGYRS